MQVEKLVSEFRSQCEKKKFFGGQLVISREGKILVEESTGFATGLRDTDGPRSLVQHDTQFQVMSASKPVLAIAIAMLEERGLLNVNERVAHYIPGFEHNQKGDITVLDVLHYRSGVIMEEFVKTPERWHDWDNVVHAMKQCKPMFPRGVLAYQPASFGWILAEIVRQISGLSVEQFFQSEMPPSLQGLHWRYGGPAAMTYWEGKSPFMLAGHDLSDNFEHVNNEVSARTALVPGAGMYTTARSLATFYDMLLQGGVSQEGTRVLSEETLAKYISMQTSGMDKHLGVYLRLGRGVSFGWAFPHFYGWWASSHCYGHAGGFSTVAFADQKTRTSVAYVTNSNRSVSDLMKRIISIASQARK